MTSGHKVSLWQPGGHIPYPSVLLEGWRKGPDRSRERESEGEIKVKGASQRKAKVNESQEDEEGARERGAKLSGKERERERAAGFWGSETLVELKLVRSQSWVLGMKTGRAVCRSQAWDSALLEKSSFFPQICTLTPSPCIHHPIHHSLYSTTWPPLLDSATLSNRPDGLNEIHPTVCSHLNHCNVTGLLSCFICNYSLASTKLVQLNVTLARSCKNWQPPTIWVWSSQVLALRNIYC